MTDKVMKLSQQIVVGLFLNQCEVHSLQYLIVYDDGEVEIIRNFENVNKSKNIFTWKQIGILDNSGEYMGNMNAKEVADVLKALLAKGE